MNRIEFFNDCGEVKMELQEVTTVDEEGAKAKFKIKDKPVYLCVRFLRPVTEEELRGFYAILLEHEVIQFLKGRVEQEIKDDLDLQSRTNRPFGTFELKTTFVRAFACAQALAYTMPFAEDAFALAINDEPSDSLVKWLQHKRESKIRRIKNLQWESREEPASV